MKIRPGAFQGGTTPALGLQALPISWSGNPWSLVGLSFLNFFLAIVTAGIYGFWGRTEVRRRIWSSIHLDGEPLAYTGTGKELFLGFLIVFGVVLLPTLLISFAAALTFGPNSAGIAVTQILMGLTFVFLSGVAVYRARRYRLSRTNWRGIRGSLEGSSWAYGWTNFWTTMIVPVLLAIVAAAGYFAIGKPNLTDPVAARVFAQSYGPLIGMLYFAAIILWLLLVPWRTTKLQRAMTNDMAFGSRPFEFIGSMWPLYLRFVARWVGVLILALATPAALYLTIGTKLALIMAESNRPGPSRVELTGGEAATLIAILLTAVLLYSVLTAWYKAAEANYFAGVTRYEGQPFKLSITAGGLIWLAVTNTLLTLLTLSILRPVAMARTARYLVSNLGLDGPIDVAAIAQSQAAMSRTGEGLAQAFDVDAF